MVKTSKDEYFCAKGCRSVGLSSFPHVRQMLVRTEAQTRPVVEYE